MHRHSIIKNRTHNMKCRSTSNTAKKHMHNISKAPTELNTKHIYQLDTADDLTSGISIAVDHRIDHKYPKLQNIPLPITEYDTIHIPRKTIIRKLQPIEIDDFEVSNISWTNDNTNSANSPVELPSMPP